MTDDQFYNITLRMDTIEKQIALIIPNCIDSGQIPFENF